MINESMQTFSLYKCTQNETTLAVHLLQGPFLVHYESPVRGQNQDCYKMHSFIISFIHCLRCSLIRLVLPAPMSFRRTVEPPGTGYGGSLHL